ncbi:hypothetical protein P4O66_009080 [Electrophorus voltai]|uniref:Mitogen-activated protein kinase binding protein 1 n=1 Tax=Electrophorus voltai TaxID=2609070 RepID=A0AAD8ZDJ6_9TELE|nr:hypothetical protein P4O66_009080 [Electrophorus voltai]
MDGSTIKNRLKSLLRSPSIKLRKSRRSIKENFTNKVTLERVLGITTTGNSGLACDPCSGTVAYPAGCVVVLLNPKKNRQQHINNTSRKTITTLSFSLDGKYLVTGETGHLPAVRVWDVAEGSQVTELQEHKYGVACVAFSPNSKYIVSVGYQHDMGVNVWAWKKNTLVAANKVSSKVTAVSFSEDSSYFVTAGNRHVRFWYLEPCNSLKQLAAPVPLLGRSALLGELQNNNFCDVACGYGDKSECTFCITSSGLLCEFNEKRMLDKWVDLRTRAARALSVTEDLIFCACADGTVRVFSPADLRFLCTLPHPHHLGSDVAASIHHSHLLPNKPDAHYPDSVAVTYDPVNLWLSCVYNDHSLYVWDVQELQRVGKVHSALYHSACVWDLQIYPKDTEGRVTGLDSSELFVTCSEDGTIRMWSTEAYNNPASHNSLSGDLWKVIYINNKAESLLHTEETATSSTEKPDAQSAENQTGIRTICVSPDGKHLASGDRIGILRVHDFNSMEEILNAEIHDSEVLCLEYSKSKTGMKLLATAGRDRLIHVLDVAEDYRLLQTLDEHSSSITAIRFAVSDGKVRMISCGADKSVYFRTAHRTFRGIKFKCTHHVVRKSTLYDMDVDPTCKYAAVGCQDRSIRVFNISSGKQKKSFKGSQTEDGSLLRVQMDPSGLYVATSCTDKNLSLFDFQKGVCLAAMFGHSEIITGIKFTSDCRHLISISGDSCIFVWRLAPELTMNMRRRLEELHHWSSESAFASSMFRSLRVSLRRSSTGSPNPLSHMPLLSCSSEAEEDDEEGLENQASDEHEMIHPILVEEGQGASDEGTDWDTSTKESSAGSCASEPHLPDGPRQRRRWSCSMGSLELMAKSMLELRQLESASKPSSARSGSAGQLCSRPGGGMQTERQHACPHSAWEAPGSPEGVVLYPELCPSTGSLPLAYQGQDEEAQSQHKHSRDSGSSTGYGGSSPERGSGGSDDPESLSSDEEPHTPDEEEEEDQGKLFHKSKQCMPECFLKEHFDTLAGTDTTGNQFRHKGSSSTQFLAQGSSTRTGRKSDQGPSAAVKPLISAACPLHEEKSEWPGLEERVEDNPPEQPLQLHSTPQRSKASGPHSGRVSSHVGKPATGLLKSISAHNLTAGSRRPVTLSHLKQESRAPWSQLITDRCDGSLPSPTGSSSPLPWESPGTSRRLKARSYMSPTTSSRAKLHRLASVGDGLHLAVGGGEAISCSGPFRSAACPSLSSTPPRVSLSASLPGLCNSNELRSRCSEGAWTPPPKSSKTRASERTSNPSLEYPSRPRKSTDAAAHTHACAGTGVHSMDASCLKAQRQAAKPASPLLGRQPVKDGMESFSHAPQRERPLVAVKAFTMTSESQTEENLVNLEICRQAAEELCSSMRKATQLYRVVNSGVGTVEVEQPEMVRVLEEALLLVLAELEVKPWSASERGERTLALLEQYSQLLLQSVEKRLNHRI